MVKNLTTSNLNVDKFASYLDGSITNSAMICGAHTHSRQSFKLIVCTFYKSIAGYLLTVLGMDSLTSMAIRLFLCLYLGC